ncbi:11826_t:CDS:2, partial [Racocetra persica]
DKEDYIHFLKTSLINDNEQSFPQTSLGKASKNEFGNVVNAVITDLVNDPNWSPKKPPNVLSLGFKKLPNDDKYGSTVFHENSCTDYIRCLPAMTKLYSRLGEKAMTYLLKNTSIFIFLSNSSYLQVTGLAISELPNPNIGGTFVRTSSQESFVEVGPQDMYMEDAKDVDMCLGIQHEVERHESESYIPDLEILSNEEYSPEVTPKKRALDDPHSQYEEISKATKYNNNDSVRTFLKSNPIRTSFPENLPLDNVPEHIPLNNADNLLLDNAGVSDNLSLDNAGFSGNLPLNNA